MFVRHLEHKLGYISINSYKIKLLNAKLYNNISKRNILKRLLECVFVLVV